MKVGVIGAGTMGQGIAKAFAQVEGYTVALCDIKQEWADNGKAKIAAGYAKLVAKVNRLPYKDVIDDLDLGSVIYPKYITSDSILRYVRAMQNTIGSNVETLYHVLDNQAEALEFIIRDNSPVVGIPLAELNLKSNLLVCCLTRKGTVRIPRGQDTLQIGDNVVIVTTSKGLRDIRDILA